MKSIIILLFCLVTNIVYSQNLQIVNSNDMRKIELANDTTYKILANKNNLTIDDNLKRKITTNRKDKDFIWEPEKDLKILIYKKDE